MARNLSLDGNAIFFYTSSRTRNRKRNVSSLVKEMHFPLRDERKCVPGCPEGID
jgi:hypothetical protein